MNYLKNKTIKLRNLLCLILIIPFIEPLLFKEPEYIFVDKMYSYLKIFSLFVVLCLNLFSQSLRKIHINKPLILLISFEAITGFSTILHGGDFVKYCGPAVNVMGLSLLCIYFYPKLKIDFFKIFLYFLYVLLIINNLSVVFFPNGIVRNSAWTNVYFLGIDNRFIFFYLPFIFFLTIYEILKCDKLNFYWYLGCFLALFPLIYLWSVGAMIGLIVLIFSILLFINSKKITNVNFNFFFNIILVLNILIVFLNVQNYFSDFITNILKKDITLSGRTYLWKNAFEMFRKNPLLGFGVQSNEYLSNVFYGGVTHPHNLFLKYLIEGGIVGVSLYLIFITEFIKDTKKIKNKKIKFIFNITVFIVLLLSLADSLDIGMMYIIFILGMIYHEVENETK